MSAQHINFNKNWNNKLLNPCFTTIRLRNDAKYQVGQTYDIHFSPDKFTINNLGLAFLADVKHFKLHELNLFMSMLDMGLHHFEGKIMLQEMYYDRKVDWAEQQLSYLLLEQQDTGIRNIIPDRIKKVQPETNLFTSIPFGYEAIKTAQ
jgi:hypothetical protein